MIAISNIAYLRALFPEDSFVDRRFEGFNIKILRPDATSLDSKILSEWLRGAFEAIDLKYVIFFNFIYLFYFEEFLFEIEFLVKKFDFGYL